MHYFSAIAGSILGGKMDITSPPPPLMDILVKYVSELRRTYPTGPKKFYQHTVTLTSYIFYDCVPSFVYLTLT